MADERLEPCPFCQGVNTELKPAPGMRVEVHHWCDPVDDEYVTGQIRIRARDEAQAIEEWNARR